MKTELKSSNFRYLLEEFTGYLKTLEKSWSMQVNYPKGLKEYFLFLENNLGVKHINRVDTEHFESFNLHLQSRVNLNTGEGGISNQTINGIIKANNLFTKFIAERSEGWKYAITADYLPVNTAEKLVLTQDEVKELYNATFESYPHKPSSIEFGQRDRVIIGLLYSAGLRLNEARHIDIDDIDFLNKKILVRKAKYSKERYVPIPNQVIEDIRAYIQQGRYYFTERHYQSTYCRSKSIQKKGYVKNDPALLLNIEGTRLMSFTSRLDYLKSRTNIQKHITPHILRHSVATHLHQNGLKLEKIQMILGHASIDTVQIYVRISENLVNEGKEIHQ